MSDGALGGRESDQLSRAFHGTVGTRKRQGPVILLAGRGTREGVAMEGRQAGRGRLGNPHAKVSALIMALGNYLFSLSPVHCIRRQLRARFLIGRLRLPPIKNLNHSGSLSGRQGHGGDIKICFFFLIFPPEELCLYFFSKGLLFLSNKKKQQRMVLHRMTNITL